MMKSIVFTSVLAVSLSLSAFAQQQPAGTEMQDAMKALGMLMGGGGATNQQVIHQRQLRELLPAEFDGMKRTNVEAGKNAAFGMNISYAQATYSQGSSKIDVKMSDISAMGEFMKMAQYAWAQTEMERESDDGYERTTKIEGHAAQEKYDSRYQTGKVEIMVDGRFMVEVTSAKVPMEKVHALIKAINLGKLASLKPEPTP